MQIGIDQVDIAAAATIAIVGVAAVGIGTEAAYLNSQSCYARTAATDMKPLAIAAVVTDNHHHHLVCQSQHPHQTFLLLKNPHSLIDKSCLLLLDDDDQAAENYRHHSYHFRFL